MLVKICDWLQLYPGADLIRRRGPNVLQEGYGSAAVLPEQGIYLAASIYRPVLQVLLIGSLNSFLFRSIKNN